MIARTTFMAGLFVAVVSLGACDLTGDNRRADAEARRFYEALRSGQNLAADARLAAAMRTPAALADLAVARGRAPRTEARTIENRSWRYSSSPQGNSAFLVHVYRYPDRSIVAETTLLRPPGSADWQVIGFRLRVEAPEAAPLTPQERARKRVAPDPALQPKQT